MFAYGCIAHVTNISSLEAMPCVLYLLVFGGISSPCGSSRDENACITGGRGGSSAPGGPPSMTPYSSKQELNNPSIDFPRVKSAPPDQEGTGMYQSIPS
jgi:hypothetical protein